MEIEDSFCRISPMNPFLNNILVEFSEEEEEEKCVINNYETKETVFETIGFDPISDLEQIENNIINNCLSDNELDQNNDNLSTNADNDSDVEIMAESKDDLLLGSQLLQQKYNSYIDIHKECKTQALNEKLIRIQLDSELELERQQRIQFQQQLQEYTQTSLQRQFNDSKQIKQLKFELLKCRQELFTLKTSLNNHNNIDLNPNEFNNSSDNSNYKEFNCIDCSNVMKSEVSMILHMINHCIDEQEFHLSTTFFKLEEFTDSMIDSVRKSVSYVCPRCSLSFNCVDIYYHLYKYHTKEQPLMCTSCNIYSTHLDYLRAHHQESHSGIIHKITYANINHNNQRSQTSKPHNNGLNQKNIFRPYDIKLSTRSRAKPISSSVSSNTSANNKSKPISSSSSDNTSDDPEIIHLSDSEPPLAQNSGSHKSMISISRTVPQPEHECTFADCDFKTTSKDKLDFHVSAHTNSKFKCPYCPYVGNVLNDIYRHIQKSKKHEGLRIYECRECDYGSNCLSTFKEHLSKRHFGAESDDEEDITDYISNMFRNEHSIEDKSDSS